jgi:dTDP-4-dehydrorhamnose reductase
VLGASGLVGSRVSELWADRYELIAPSHARLDVLDVDALANFVCETNAQTVVNLAAWADVDGAEPQRGDTSGAVYRLNVDYPRRLSELCARQLKHLVHVSTDYVFDGTRTTAPYSEQDATRAVCWYAETKLMGEQAALGNGQNVCIARIEMPFTGRTHRKSDLARTMASRLQRGQPIQGVTDQRITPVFLDDAVNALGELVDTHYKGIIHVAASTWTTPYEFACGLADRLRLPSDLIEPQTFAHFSGSRPARRPQHSWLDVSHFTQMYGTSILRSVNDELNRWARQWQSS